MYTEGRVIQTVIANAIIHSIIGIHVNKNKIIVPAVISAKYPKNFGITLFLNIKELKILKYIIALNQLIKAKVP